MEIKATNTTAVFTAGQTVILPVFKEALQSRSFAQLADQLEFPLEVFQKEIGYKKGKIQPLYARGIRYFLLGMGDSYAFADTLRSFRRLSQQMTEKDSGTILIDVQQLPEALPLMDFVEAATNGLFLGTYQVGRFKSERPSDIHPLLQQEAAVSFLLPASADSTLANRRIRQGQIMAEAQMGVFDLVNAPSNKKTPAMIEEWVKGKADSYGVRFRAFSKAELEAEGFHALLAVNQGSADPPAFLVMEYRCTAEARKQIGLVGKGVTFDTGGVSIKASTNMANMKSDMAGAAAIVGTMLAAARLQLPVNLIAALPFTDNSVGSKAIKPSDVIDSYSGQTIEIIDTDAEGRLILADGLSYISRNYRPDHLINLATLTGSSVGTLGFHAAALFSNDDALAEALYDSSQQNGELLWRLPLWDIYRDDIKSDVADVRNYSGRPLNGAIGAAKFLEHFIDGHESWAHLDIAGVAFRDNEFTKLRSATAYGVRLLIDYLQKI